MQFHSQEPLCVCVCECVCECVSFALVIIYVRVVIANVNTNISCQFQQVAQQYIVQQIYTVSGSNEGESLFLTDYMIWIYSAVNNLWDIDTFLYFKIKQWLKFKYWLSALI